MTFDLNTLSMQAGSAFRPIPDNSLVWADLYVQDVKTSAAGNTYLNCRLIVPAGHKWQNKNIFQPIVLQRDGGAETNAWGLAACRDIVLSNGGELKAYETAEELAAAIHGSRVGVKVGIKRDNPSENEARVFLCPVEQYGTSRDWEKLQAETEQWFKEHGESQQTPATDVPAPPTQDLRTNVQPTSAPTPPRPTTGFGTAFAKPHVPTNAGTDDPTAGLLDDIDGKTVEEEKISF